LEKERYCILIFGQKTFKTLQIRRKTLRIGSFLLAFTLLFINLLLCDYIQLKKERLEIHRLRQEMNAQRSQIQFFSDGIENLERQVSKLNRLDRKIRMIANLQGIEERKEGGPEILKKHVVRLEEMAAPERVVYAEAGLASFQATNRHP